MTEIKNTLIIDTSEALKELKAVDAGMSKLKENTDKIAEASTKAFSGQNITDYKTKLAELTIELQKQKDLSKSLGIQEQKTLELQKAGIKGLEGELSKIQKERIEAVKKQQELTTEIKKTNAALKETNQTQKQVTKATNEQSTAYGKMISTIKNLVGAYISLQAVMSAAKEVERQTVKMNSLSAAFNLVITDADQLNKVMSKLNSMADNYGISILDLKEQYLKFAAASKGTSLEGNKALEVFDKIAKATSVMGIGTEQTNRVFLALTQMMSKGKVSAEELRQQLGEALPGAMNIMARGMGVTTAQLDEMLRKGQVMASVALPKFADELVKTFGVDKIDRVETLAAAQGRFRTEITRTIEAMAASGTIKNYYTILTDAVDRLALLDSRLRRLFKDADTRSRMAAEAALDFLETNSGKKVRDLLVPFNEMDILFIKKNLDTIKSYFVNTFIAEGESNETATELWDAYYNRRYKAEYEFATKRKKLKTAAELKAENEVLEKYLKNLEEFNKKTSAELNATPLTDPNADKNLIFWTSPEEVEAREKDKLNIQKSVNDAVVKDKKDQADELKEIQDNLDKDAEESARERARTELEIERQKERDKLELQRAAVDTAQMLISSYFSYAQSLDENAKMRELQSAGDNAEKIKQINNKYAEKEKERAISQTWINAILGAANAVATAGNIYAGLVIAAGILASAAWYTAEIQAQPVSFSKGVIKLKRRSKDKMGIDTIPAFLNEGESVMTTEETNENEGLFKAIREGKRDEYIHRNFVVPQIDKEYINKMKRKSDESNESSLTNLISNGIKAELNDYKLRQKLERLIESGDRNTARLIHEIQKNKLRR